MLSLVSTKKFPRHGPSALLSSYRSFQSAYATFSRNAVVSGLSSFSHAKVAMGFLSGVGPVKPRRTSASIRRRHDALIRKHEITRQAIQTTRPFARARR